MRPVRTAVAAAIATAAVSGFHTSSAAVRAGRAGAHASPASGTSILVTPRRPHPGETVHISVPDCSVGPTPHIARSAAFTRPALLYGKADTGEADPMIRPSILPGAYPIVAFCGPGQTRHGRIGVVPGPGGTGAHGTAPALHPPATARTVRATAAPVASGGHDGAGAGAVAWLAGTGVVLAGVAALAVARRRTRP